MDPHLEIHLFRNGRFFGRIFHNIYRAKESELRQSLFLLRERLHANPCSFQIQLIVAKIKEQLSKLEKLKAEG